MKKCIIFASHIPSPDKLSVGVELLNIFVKSFNEYDIYIGINNSCQEWHDCVEEYSKYLNIFCETTPDHLLINSDASAFQSALRLLKHTGNKYGIFGLATQRVPHLVVTILEKKLLTFFGIRRRLLKKR